MMKKTLLLLAVSVIVLGVAGGSSAVETGFIAKTDGGRVTEALAVGSGETKGKELNGFISGQFLPGIMTDGVKGGGTSARPALCVAWNGFVIGTGGSPRETQDVAMLATPESKGKEAWDGYPAGSLGYWQRKP